MRLPAVLGLAMTMAGFATEPAAPALAGQPAPPVEARAGCVRTGLGPCIISLGAAMVFDANLLASQIADRNAVDVDGKPVSRTVSLYASFPRHLEHFEISLHLASPAPNDTVVRVEASLPRDPALAKTANDYDQTFIYELMSTLLGNRCLNIERLTLYQFFENTVKPRIVSETTVEKRGRSARTTLVAHADKLPYCGIHFTYTRVTGSDGGVLASRKRGPKMSWGIELE